MAGEDGGFGIRVAAAVQPSERKATACAIFAQLPAYRYLSASRPCWTLRGSKSRAEQDELSLQTRISDVFVTLLLGTDPVQGRETHLVVALASANSLVSSQAPDSRRRVRSASKVSGSCDVEWLVVVLGEDGGDDDPR